MPSCVHPSCRQQQSLKKQRVTGESSQAARGSCKDLRRFRWDPAGHSRPDKTRNMINLACLFVFAPECMRSRRLSAPSWRSRRRRAAASPKNDLGGRAFSAAQLFRLFSALRLETSGPRRGLESTACAGVLRSDERDPRGPGPAGSASRAREPVGDRGFARDLEGRQEDVVVLRSVGRQDGDRGVTGGDVGLEVVALVVIA